MSSRNIVLLGELLRSAKLERAGGRQLPILSMTMHEGLVDQAAKFKKRVASADISSYKVVSRNQLVVGFPIDEGVLSVQDLYDRAVVSPAYDVWDIREERVLAMYLERFLRSPSALHYYAMKLQGTTARRRSLPDELFLQLRVPLPPLAEQRRIAETLDKVDSFRRKRKEAIALTEELLRSAFLETFGDPVTNPKGWPVVPLVRLGAITTGNTPSRDIPEYFGDEIEWIKSDNINTPSHYLTRAAEGLSKKGRAVGRTVPAGSSLVTCIAGSPDCIGNVGLANREVAFNQQINAVTPHERVDHRFLYVLLLVGKRLVQGASTNSMKGMVSKGKLEQVAFPAPPGQLQLEFGKTFERIVGLNRHHESAAMAADDLFRVTVVRAFRGELTTSETSARQLSLLEGERSEGAQGRGRSTATTVQP